MGVALQPIPGWMPHHSRLSQVRQEVFPRLREPRAMENTFNGVETAFWLGISISRAVLGIAGFLPLFGRILVQGVGLY